MDLSVFVPLVTDPRPVPEFLQGEVCKEKQSLMAELQPRLPEFDVLDDPFLRIDGLKAEEAATEDFYEARVSPLLTPNLALPKPSKRRLTPDERRRNSAKSAGQLRARRFITINADSYPKFALWLHNNQPPSPAFRLCFEKFWTLKTRLKKEKFYNDGDIRKLRLQFFAAVEHNFELVESEINSGASAADKFATLDSLTSNLYENAPEIPKSVVAERANAAKKASKSKSNRSDRKASNNRAAKSFRQREQKKYTAALALLKKKHRS